jgi:hypothetical protein
MYWIILFSLLYFVKKYVNNEIYGKDERIVIYPSKINYENTTSEKVLQIYETSEKITFLKSKNVSLDDKLYEIGNRNIPEAINIFNGGLFNDWDFDFF